MSDTSDAWPPVKEPLRRTLLRNVTIAGGVGVVTGLVRSSPLFVLSGALLALWPALGGHYVEIAFLNGVRARLPRARVVQVSARLLWWLAGGIVLGAAVIATAHALPLPAPSWRRLWVWGPLFVGIELVVHAVLALRGRPSFYRGDG
jgi:hypothetical protein